MSVPESSMVATHNGYKLPPRQCLLCLGMFTPEDEYQHTCTGDDCRAIDSLSRLKNKWYYYMTQLRQDPPTPLVAELARRSFAPAVRRLAEIHIDEGISGEHVEAPNRSKKSTKLLIGEFLLMCNRILMCLGTDSYKFEKDGIIIQVARRR